MRGGMSLEQWSSLFGTRDLKANGNNGQRFVHFAPIRPHCLSFTQLLVAVSSPSSVATGWVG